MMWKPPKSTASLRLTNTQVSSSPEKSKRSPPLYSNTKCVSVEKETLLVPLLLQPPNVPTVICDTVSSPFATQPAPASGLNAVALGAPKFE